MAAAGDKLIFAADEIDVVGRIESIEVELTVNGAPMPDDTTEIPAYGVVFVR